MHQSEIIMTGDRKRAGVDALGATNLPEFESAAAATTSALVAAKSVQPIALTPVGTRLSPGISLAWVVGVLALAASAAPWPRGGWSLFELIGTAVMLVVFCDAMILCLTWKKGTPVFLPPKKGLRGREGQTIEVPLALAGVERWKSSPEVRVGIMAATPESEAAIQLQRQPQRLKLERSNFSELNSIAAKTQLQLWPWMPEITLLRRGLWPAPRVGIERWSRFRIWRLRQWFDVPVPLRIDADLRLGRKEILRSPLYRLLVASQQTPWTGHGRDFERLRDYQPGDNYSEIAWKSTARRAAPVTRLFQWEQKQEIYFVVDQSRASAHWLDSHSNTAGDSSNPRARRCLLDLAVETALVGATVALELGDEFGLVTYADEPKSWLRAGGGQSHFHQFRERLLNIEPLPTTADYEVLFGEIRVRLRRRAYLLVLANLAERSLSDSLRRGFGLVRSSHVLLMTSILPDNARPAFSPGEELHSEQDVYAALAGEKENQRLNALARQMRQFNVQLRYTPPQMFLRTAIEGYLETKREQRL